MVEAEIRRSGAGGLVSKPRLPALEGERFEIDLELVDEELSALREFAQVADAEDADKVYEASVALVAVLPLSVDRHKLLSLRIFCASISKVQRMQREKLLYANLIYYTVNFNY